MIIDYRVLSTDNFNHTFRKRQLEELETSRKTQAGRNKVVGERAGIWTKDVSQLFIRNGQETGLSRIPKSQGIIYAWVEKHRASIISLIIIYYNIIL